MQLTHYCKEHDTEVHDSMCLGLVGGHAMLGDPSVGHEFCGWRWSLQEKWSCKPCQGRNTVTANWCADCGLLSLFQTLTPTICLGCECAIGRNQHNCELLGGLPLFYQDVCRSCNVQAPGLKQGAPSASRTSQIPRVEENPDPGRPFPRVAVIKAKHAYASPIGGLALLAGLVLAGALVVRLAERPPLSRDVGAPSESGANALLVAPAAGKAGEGVAARVATVRLHAIVVIEASESTLSNGLDAERAAQTIRTALTDRLDWSSSDCLSMVAVGIDRMHLREIRTAAAGTALTLWADRLASLATYRRSCLNETRDAGEELVPWLRSVFASPPLSNGFSQYSLGAALARALPAAVRGPFASRTVVLWLGPVPWSNDRLRASEETTLRRVAGDAVFRSVAQLESEVRSNLTATAAEPVAVGGGLAYLQLIELTPSASFAIQGVSLAETVQAVEDRQGAWRLAPFKLKLQVSPGFDPSRTAEAALVAAGAGKRGETVLPAQPGVSAALLRGESVWLESAPIGSDGQAQIDGRDTRALRLAAAIRARLRVADAPPIALDYATPEAFAGIEFVTWRSQQASLVALASGAALLGLLLSWLLFLRDPVLAAFRICLLYTSDAADE